MAKNAQKSAEETAKNAQKAANLNNDYIVNVNLI